MRTALAVAVSASVLSGCRSFYPMQGTEAVVPAETVAITFAAPRDLEATRDTVRYALPAVMKVYGKVEDVRADTLVLRVLLVESDGRPLDRPRNTRLALVPDATAQVAVRRISGGKTTALLSGLTLLAALALELANYQYTSSTPITY